MRSMTYFVNILKRNGNIYNNLKNFFKLDDGNNYAKFLSYLSNSVDLQKILNKPIYQENLDESSSWFFLRDLPLSKVLLWNCLYFSQYITELNQFEKLKSDFENLFLSKKYSDCLKVLEKAEELFGISLWLIENYAILGTFDSKLDDYEKMFAGKALDMFQIFKIKNNINEQNSYYRKRISSLFENSNLKDDLKHYYMHKLYYDVIRRENEWSDVLFFETNFSLIDIYLTTKICLQYMSSPKKVNVSKSINECYEVISSINSHDNTASLEFFAKEFNNGEYKNVVKHFFGEEFDLYNVFDTHKLTALSLLMSNNVPDDASNVISYRIVRDIFYIFGRSKHFIEAIDDLCTLSRILQPFNMHKNICVFISLITNSGESNITEQCSSLSEVFMSNYETESLCPLLLPYKSMYTDEDYETLATIEDFLEVNTNLSMYAKNYFREAQNRLKIKLLIKEEKLTEASALFVQAYTENICFVYGIDISDIRKNLKHKLELSNANTGLSLEECCYIFIDPEFSKFQRTCFLNFLDDCNFNEPLDIIEKTSFNRSVVTYFLNEICDINMLSKIYWLYSSTEEAINYRIRICKYLLDNNNASQKKIETELEELTKNLAIKKHLQNVDKSRISIDAESFRNNIINELNECVNLYNISNKFDYYKFGSFMEVVILSDPIRDILTKMYYLYAQEFCFGDNGVDTSLSTRVRHGTLSNQVLRTFSDNYLDCDGHGSNSYFEGYIGSNTIDSSIRKTLLNFADKIQNHLNYATQHTLKVFINESISGAVFDYNLTHEEEQQIYNSITVHDKISSDDFINVIYPLLIKKTNKFLEQIRCIEIPKLKSALVNELDSFCNEIQSSVNNNLVLREIEGKIADCKTALQTEFNAITKWFYITEIQDWEDFDIDVLIDTCIEIEKKLFSGFDLVKITRDVNNTKYQGKMLRYFIDIFLILFHNAISHSGYRDSLSNLEINFSVNTDADSVYFVVENNLSDLSDIENLKLKLEKYNDDYNQYRFLEINTRQEGGMGLYKIMSMLYSITKHMNMFYITVKDNKVRVEIKIKKELICYE